MKTNLLKTLQVAGLLAWPACLAGADEEQDHIQILSRDASVTQKSDAASKLRMVGTANAVPALEALLTEEGTAQVARHALEGMPFPEAGAALRQALGRSSGLIKVGLVDSLGWRREPDAVPLLEPLLSDPDAALASAAALALGRIGGNEALAALESARRNARSAALPTLLEGLMLCAEPMLETGDQDQHTKASLIYRSIFDSTPEGSLRTAAYAGMIRASTDGGFALIISALDGSDQAAQAAALQLAGDLEHPATTKALTGLLPNSSAAMQIALLTLLQARGDLEVLPAVLMSARSSDPSVRAAAVAALGALGDANVVPLLAEAATSRDAMEQSAARLALIALHRGEVTAALAALLATAAPPVQIELVRALSARSDASAVPALLELSGNDRSPARRAALQALGQLVDSSHLTALVRLLVQTKEEAARGQVRAVFESLIERTADPKELELDPILRGLAGSDPETRKALLPVGVLFVDDRLRAALRAALMDTDESIRNAAARALCASRDARLLPDMLDVAYQAKDASLRSLAFEGVVRLATDEGVALSAQRRAATLDAAFALATRPEEKRMVLSGLARVPHPVSLGLADQACADPTVKQEAELACLQIARGLGASDFVAVEPVLTRLVADTGDLSVRTQAQALLKQLDSGWLYAGPYRAAGKQAQELFETLFAPERTDAGTVKWQPAPGSADLTRIGEVDLAGIVRGDHCVVYAKTRVFVPAARSVSFAIGSDDGIKLWVNAELIHANNAVRGLTPDQDRATGQLREGWNDLLAKITQHTAGCGFTLRITTANGADIPGLRLGAE